MNGLVDPITEAVAADEDSRIEEILVRTGKPVKKGDQVVKLDTEILDAQIGKLEAAIRSDLEDRLLNYELDLGAAQGARAGMERDESGTRGNSSRSGPGGAACKQSSTETRTTDRSNSMRDSLPNQGDATRT